MFAFFDKISYFCIMDFYQLVAKRRSCRSFSSEELDGDEVQTIIRAALMSPTSMNRRSWHFILVDERMNLEKLSDAKESGASFLKDAALAVVVTGCPSANDCWVEDGSIAAFSMQLQAEDMGISSCWVQIRGRRLSDGTPASDVVRGILDIPEGMEVLCIVAFGKKNGEALPPREDADLHWENVHVGLF